MIRFSAALVAVAIGVLVGGIAASELVLVYIAIVVSAVALVALAVGVVLKREELFGEGQGLAPATAGATPVPPVRAGESHAGKDRQETRVTLPPLQGTAVGPGAAFGGDAQVASWGTHTSRSPWPPTAPAAPPAWVTAAQDEPTGNSDGTGADSRAASAWQPTAPSSETPSAWAMPSPSVTPESGSGSIPPGWFDRMDKPASADAPATPSPSASGSGWSSGGDTAAPGDSDKADDTAARDATATPADAATVVDEDEDWPTRYSWLDDEPDENGEASDDADLDDQSLSAVSAAALAAEPATSSDSGTPDTQTLDTAAPEGKASEPGDADAAENADADVAAPAGHSDGLSLAGDPDQGAGEADEAESGRPAAPPADAAPGTGLVTVIRGVPRYHDPDCVLIRFMPERDSKKLSVAQAKEAGCTPCAACQPEG